MLLTSTDILCAHLLMLPKSCPRGFATSKQCLDQGDPESIVVHQVMHEAVLSELESV